jgi:membrane protease YdiL (CAAX protease family)
MKNAFSLPIYLALVISLSWPFQIAYFFLGETYKPLLLVSMVMVAVGTYVCGKYVFKDGFANAGWCWGKPKHYFFVFLLALFLWFFPSLIERVMGWYSPKQTNIVTIVSTFSYSFLITIIPAFSEEFGWRGYLLPRLLKKYAYRKALLLHGLITWIWHLPFVVIMALQMEGNAVVSVTLVLGVSFIPTILHAVVFAYIWNRTTSLAVSTLYHVCFDEVRDTLEGTIGLGAFGQNWQMIVLTALGLFLLWKGKWKLKQYELQKASNY